MANQQEIEDLLRKGKEDGTKLSKAADTIYTWLVVLNWLTAIGGLFGGIAVGGLMGPGYAFLVLATVALVCVLEYALAVLSTHGAKVLVHILNCRLATLPIPPTMVPIPERPE